MGTSSLSLPDGGTEALTPPGVGGNVGAAFGAALRRGDGLRTVIHDDYKRLFSVNLADGLPGERRGALLTPPPIQASSQVVLGGPALGGLNLAVSIEAPVFDERANEPEPSLTLGPQPMRSMRMQAAYGRLSLSNWSGEGGAQAPAGPAGRDAFQTIARPDRSTQAALRLGRFALMAEQGSAHPRRPLQIVEIEGSSYASATGMVQVGDAVISLTGGSLEEPLGPLGSIPDARHDPGPAGQDPVRGGDDRPLSASGPDAARRPVDRPDGRGGRPVVAGQGDQQRLAAGGRRRLRAGGVVLRAPDLRISQPLRIESGKFQAVLADVPLAYDDPLTFSTRRFSASPDGRELDLTLGVEHAFGPWRSLVVRTSLALQPGHQADAAPEVGALATWRSRF